MVICSWGSGVGSGELPASERPRFPMCWAKDALPVKATEADAGLLSNAYTPAAVARRKCPRSMPAAQKNERSQRRNRHEVRARVQPGWQRCSLAPGTQSSATGPPRLTSFQSALVYPQVFPEMFDRYVKFIPKLQVLSLCRRAGIPAKMFSFAKPKCEKEPEQRLSRRGGLTSQLFLFGLKPTALAAKPQICTESRRVISDGHKFVAISTF